MGPRIRGVVRDRQMPHPAWAKDPHPKPLSRGERGLPFSRLRGLWRNREGYGMLRCRPEAGGPAAGTATVPCPPRGHFSARYLACQFVISVVGVSFRGSGVLTTKRPSALMS